MGARPLILIAIAVTAVAGIGQIVGVATPDWVNAGDDTGKVSFGLWKYCTSIEGQGSVCMNFGGDVADWVKVTRALGIIALLLMGLGGACGIIHLIKPDNLILSRISAAWCTFGFSAAIASVITFGVKYDQLLPDFADTNYGYSFGLVIAAAILSLIAAVLYRVAWRQQGFV